MSPVSVRNSDSVFLHLVVDRLEHLALSDPFADLRIFSSSDDTFSGRLPSLGSISHVFTITIPHDPVSDDACDGLVSSATDAEFILLAQFLDVVVEMVVVGSLGGVGQVVEDVVENSLSVSSVILDHVIDSHHVGSSVVLFDVHLA